VGDRIKVGGYFREKNEELYLIICPCFMNGGYVRGKNEELYLCVFQS
jgi:hypothetical protein